MLAALLIQLAVLGADAGSVQITWDPDIVADLKRGGYDLTAAKMINDAAKDVTYALTLPLQKPLQIIVYAPRAYEKSFAPGRQARLFAHYSDGKIHIDGGSRVDAFFNSVVVHEMTLAVLDADRHGAAIPTWMREGLATVLDQESLGRTKLDVTQRILLQDALRKGDIQGLASVKQPLEPTGYLECQAAVVLLMEHYGRTPVMQLFHDLAKGDAPDKAWKKVGTDPQAFAREFGAWATSSP